MTFGAAAQFDHTTFKGTAAFGGATFEQARLLGPMRPTAQVGSIRSRRDPDLLRSFLDRTGLTL
jgi:hypothetical protein